GLRPLVTRASADAGEHGLAGVGAPLAFFGAGLAVAHVGVAGALVPAAVARLHARLQHRARDVGVVLGVAGQHALGDIADVSAVQVRANALAHFGDVVLAQ